MERAKANWYLQELSAVQQRGMDEGNPLSDAWLLSEFLDELADGWVGDHTIQTLLVAASNALAFADNIRDGCLMGWDEVLDETSQKH